MRNATGWQPVAAIRDSRFAIRSSDIASGRGNPLS